MMGKTAKQSKATDRLYKAVANYLEAHGGKAIVIGGVGIMDLGGYNFNFCVRVTGNKPDKEIRHDPSE